MRILISHNNYPSQFRRLVPALVEDGNEVVFIHKNCEWHANPPNGFRLIRYQPHRSAGGEFIHPYLRRFETAVIEGQAAFRACQKLKDENWIPDVLVSHVGFGNGLYLADAFPNTPRVVLAEWYYNAIGSDVDFLNHGQVEDDRRLRLRTWNAHTLLELVGSDCAVTPTNWQRSQFPEAMQSQFTVLHEGIDWQKLSSLRSISNPCPSVLTNADNPEILTYVSRGFEEYRGFPQVMQTIAALQKRRPNFHALIAGSDVVAYGSNRTDGRGWKAWAIEELELVPERTHWLGSIGETEYHALLACSHVHLYLTVPFVLSWSLLEAMAAGCSIVASSTPPVMEVLKDRENALLVDFFDVPAQVEALSELLDDRQLALKLAAKAISASRQYDSTRCLDSWKSILSKQMR